jgi:cytochrome c oxidase subunit 1
MLLLFATPLFVGFANEIMPLQIGAPDVAFPRLNLLSYYFFLFGGPAAQLPPPGGAPGFRVVCLLAADQCGLLAGHRR